MVFEDAPEYTPVLIQLPRGLNPNDETIGVKLKFDESILYYTNFWNVNKSDPTRNEGIIIPYSRRYPGNQIHLSATYALWQVNYDPAVGVAVIYIEADYAKSGNENMTSVQSNGNNNRSFLAVELKGVGDGLELTDTVSWKNVSANEFYPYLNEHTEVQNAIASDLVYGLRDSTDFGLRLMEEDEVSEILDRDLNVVDNGQQIKDFILDVLFRRPPTSSKTSVFDPSLTVGLYLNHLSPGKPGYILSYMGTELIISTIGL